VLRESGRYEDTLVVFTSDHGELFGDHGQYGKPERMYDELLRVPLVVTNAPDSLCPTGELVSLLDVPPLWQTALGESVPAQYEGVVPGQDARSFVVAEHEVEGDAIVGVRSRNWLYERDDIRDARRLFELGSMRRVDPEMATDREARVVLRAGESRMSEIQRAGVAQDGETDGGELGSDVEARLEELGYR
jgi:arylsulfatase A-like enzyme